MEFLAIFDILSANSPRVNNTKCNGFLLFVYENKMELHLLLSEIDDEIGMKVWQGFQSQIYNNVDYFIYFSGICSAKRVRTSG